MNQTIKTLDIITADEVHNSMTTKLFPSYNATFVNLLLYLLELFVTYKYNKNTT